MDEDGDDEGILFFEGAQPTLVLGLEMSQQAPSFTFHYEGECVGRWWFDPDVRMWKFEGDIAGSARVFTDFMTERLQAWFDENYQRFDA